MSLCEVKQRSCRWAVALVGTMCFVANPSLARAQSYTVSVAESGPLATVYEKRFNWRYYNDYRHTTMVASDENPLWCKESPCLDDGEPGEQGPDATRGDTATATVGDMQPGTYQIELRYNQTANRATSVPWSVTTDAATNNTRSGTLDQRGTTPGAGKWLELGNTSTDPILVASSLTFVFGSTTKMFNGSLSYGGIRLTRVEPGAGGSGGGSVEPDGGTVEAPACAPLPSREYDAEPAFIDEPLGSTVRRTFNIDEVPAPDGISYAHLTMTLYDADHLGEEGFVYVNGQAALALPAQPSWNDASAEATLSVPPSYLVAGTNIVEFGPGTRPTTYYSVSRVGLEVLGPICAEADAGPDGSSGIGGSSGSGGSGGGGVEGTDAGGGMAGYDAGAGRSGAENPSPATSGSAETESGCGCMTGSRRVSLSTLALALAGAAGLLRRKRRRHGSAR